MFVEITRGRSFKGLAQYCLHDVDGVTAERVAFTETRNLATDDPQVAWRIMAARHYMQDDLKAKAGVGRGGPKDGKPVGHLMISWKQEEAEAQKLDRLAMINAANGALRAINADRHQALIIGHTDTNNPHCHIVVNLIGDDGRLKKNWKEREKLSRFALQKEIEVHGEPIVKRREKHWHDREAGETPTPVKKSPRHLYELDKAAEQCPQLKEFADKHRSQLAALAQAKSDQKQAHKRNRERLEWCHQERLRRLETTTEQRLRSSKTNIRKGYENNWYQLLDRQTADRRAFAANERNLKGSLANAMALIDWKRLIRHQPDPEDLTLGKAFQILTSEAVRRDHLRQRQQGERDQLRAKQRQAEQEHRRTIQQEQNNTIADYRRSYLRKADAMKERQAKCREQINEEQQRLTKDRNLALKAFRERQREARTQQVLETQQMQQPKEREQTSAIPVEKTGIDQAHKATAKPKRIRRPRKERQPRQPRQPRQAKSQQPLLQQPDQQIKDDFEERLMREFQKQQERDHDRER